MLAELRPRWLPKFANRLTKNEWEPQWPLGRALVIAGLCEKPTDPRYLEQMAGRIGPVAPTIRADPAILDDVWRVLRGEGPATFGSSAPSLMPKYPKALVRDVSPERAYWSSALIALAAEGLLDRGELIDAAVDALQRHATWPSLRWYVALLDELALSDAETAGRASVFASLLRSPLSPIVGYAQRICRMLLENDRLRPDEFLEHADAPFFLAAKNVAIEQISLVVVVGSKDGWRDEAALRLGRAFGHDRNDVQSAAIGAAAIWWRGLGEPARQELCELSESLSPSSLVEWRALTEDEVESKPVAVHQWVPPPLDAMPGPLDDHQLVLGLASMIERTATPMLVERVIEAALRIADMPLPERQRLIEPVAARARNVQFAYATLDGWALVCVSALMGQESDRSPRWGTSVARDLLDEITLAIRAGESRPYVAMPEMSDGRIDPAEAERRLANSSGAGPAERLVCQMRGDARHSVLEISEVSWEPASDVFCATATVEMRADFEIDLSGHRWLPATYDRTLQSGELRGAPLAPSGRDRTRQLELISYLAGDSYGSGTEAAWPLTLTPHHLDLPMMAGGMFLADGMEKESSVIAGSNLVELLRRLVHSDQQPGHLGGLLVAMGLGSKPVGTRLAAVEAQLSTSATQRIADLEIATAVVRLASAKQIKLRRVARALEDIMGIDPALARDQAMSVLASAIDERDAHAVASVLCDAIQLAGPVDFPPQLVEKARSKGKTKLQLQLRRLLESQS